VQRVLSLKGRFEFEIASNGKVGVAIAKKFMPDIIFLDIMMPGMNGLQVLKKLKSNPKTESIPVVILSGNDDCELQEEASQLFNEDYLLKTTSPKEFTEKVFSILDRNEAH
jgi:DNA-binding response OmpR family regulator